MDEEADKSLNSQRVFKKSSPNNKLTLYLATRDLVVETNSIDRIHGVLHLEGEQVESLKLFSQITLTFRYGREDEEVMGLKFCNEAIMSLAQVWPRICNHDMEPSTALQEALLKRLGENAYPFHLELTPLAPPSVQLVPAKMYNGAPIGTSYDVRAFIAEKVDEKKISRRNMVRMGIRVIQGATRACVAPPMPPPSPTHNSFSALAHYQLLRIKGKKKEEPPKAEEPPAEPAAGSSSSPDGPVDPPAPRIYIEKPFLLCDGKLILECWLDKSAYHHGDPVILSFTILNRSNKTVRRIKADIVQHVDICMFSNCKFKNVVAEAETISPLLPAQRLDDSYIMIPSTGVTKNWIALEDSYTKNEACLASTVLCSSDSADDRNVFAIYVSYYVKMKLSVSGIGGALSVKLPFSLSHSCLSDPPSDDTMDDAPPRLILEGRENSDDDDDDDDDDEVVDKKENADKAPANGNPETDFDDGPGTSDGRRACVSADVCVNIIENKLCEKPRFEAAPRVRNAGPDDEDMNLIVRYPGPDT